jgi:hypothetical protein
MTTVNSDEWPASSGRPAVGRRPVTVCQAAGEWARDDEGEGIRAVHHTPSEGIWTGLRNLRRPFRGVNKIYLDQYAAIFEWGDKIQRVTGEFLRAWLGIVARGRSGSPLACPS